MDSVEQASEVERLVGDDQYREAIDHQKQAIRHVIQGRQLHREVLEGDKKEL